MKKSFWFVLALITIVAGSTFAQGPFPREPRYPRDPRDPRATVKNIYVRSGQSVALMPLESVNVVCEGQYDTPLAPCVVNTRVDSYSRTFMDISVNGKLLSTVTNGGWAEVETQINRFRSMGLCR